MSKNKKKKFSVLAKCFWNVQIWKSSQKNEQQFLCWWELKFSAALNLNEACFIQLQGELRDKVGRYEKGPNESWWFYSSSHQKSVFSFIMYDFSYRVSSVLFPCLSYSVVLIS